MKEKKYLEGVKDWRFYFNERQLRSAENAVRKGNVRYFETDGRSASARVGASTSNAFRPQIHNAPTCYSEDWDEECFSCTCAAATPKTNWYGTTRKSTCAHEAAVLMLWEREHGAWFFKETDEEYEIRMEQERVESQRQQLQARREAEEKEKRSGKSWHFAQKEDRDDIFFDVPGATRRSNTNLYALNRGVELLDNNAVSFAREPVLAYGSDGAQVLQGQFVTDNPLEHVATSLTLGRDHIIEHRCDCQPRIRSFYGFYQEEQGLCPHELAALSLLWDYVNEKNPGDATDQSAEKLFGFLDQNHGFSEEQTQAEEAEKEKSVSIHPRLLIEGNSIKLTFRVSKDGRKGMILKGFRNFQEAIEEEGVFSLGKTLQIDFAHETIVDESGRWLDYIFGRIGEADRVNDRLARTSRYGYYGRSVAVQSAESLRGAAMDQFYSIAEGLDLEYEDKLNNRKGQIHIGETDIRIRMKGKALKGARDSVVGVEVTGTLPSIVQGNSGLYAISEQGIGRINDAEWASLKPFLNTWGWQETFRFSVGKNKLAEFYFRVVPALIENPCIDFQDEAEEAVATILPPEPVFVFRMDIQGERIVLRGFVSYDEDEYPLTQKPVQSGSYRDAAQENRVIACVDQFFPKWDESAAVWMSDSGDEALFKVISDGVRELSRYGEVLGTEAFYGRQVRPAPSMSVSVSVEGGLLDIRVLSQDISREELAQVYNSYQLRKKYHRLSDGSFVNLAGQDVFSSIEAVAQGLDLSVDDILSGDRELPLYRALYLDHLLEEHEELVGSRSRTYRALIKGFRTIRDSDFDVPQHMEQVLRQYQVYGHKWMRTVAETGFGGILADEMGLGKTLETISVIAAMKAEGTFAMALVVCPASLVFNWEEEIRRFAPELSAVPVAGNLRARKKLLASVGTEDGADVYITSYDLLRKDIDIYKEYTFSLMVIDEAQYIKNAKAAMTKAVKIVHADKRMALTGTPIENRLAELWSIFDFLMPGFLYDYKTFSERFEVPITKLKDESATEKLKQMVGPFILRRRKQDVLKDLPPKLEEIRYARFEEEQRKIYDAQVLRMKGMLKESEKKGEDKIKILAELMRIRQICCDPALLFEDYAGESAKRQACMELVKNAIQAGHRMLIFSQFTSMLSLLEQELQAENIPYYMITGATPKEKRIRDVHEFNEGEVPVFLISLKAGGTGLNLTGADMVIHYDPWWNLAAQNQATDRAHRIGQERIVTVYKLIAKDTIEERIVALQEAKKDLADAILSGEQKSLMSLSEEELMALL